MEGKSQVLCKGFRRLHINQLYRPQAIFTENGIMSLKESSVSTFSSYEHRNFTHRYLILIDQFFSPLQSVVFMSCLRSIQPKVSKYSAMVSSGSFIICVTFKGQASFFFSWLSRWTQLLFVLNKRSFTDCIINLDLSPYMCVRVCQGSLLFHSSIFFYPRTGSLTLLQLQNES